MEINESDQWLLDGDCSKCRREKYCTKRCKKQQEALNNLMYSAIREKTGLGPIFDRLFDHEVYK